MRIDSVEQSIIEQATYQVRVVRAAAVQEIGGAERVRRFNVRARWPNVEEAKVNAAQSPSLRTIMGSEHAILPALRDIGFQWRRSMSQWAESFRGGFCDMMIQLFPERFEH